MLGGGEGKGKKEKSELGLGEGEREVFRKKGAVLGGRIRDMVQRDRREREGDPEKGDMEVKIKG